MCVSTWVLLVDLLTCLRKVPHWHMISLVDVAVVMTTPLHVQEIFSEMVERKADSEALQLKLTFSFDDLNRKLSIRQDSVFKVSIVLQS